MKRLIIILMTPCAVFAASAIMNSFESGEITPRLYGRTDVWTHYSACRILENMFVKPLGPVEKRPGTYYIATGGQGRLFSFQHSTGETRILEFTNESIRFYK